MSLPCLLQVPLIPIIQLQTQIQCSLKELQCLPLCSKSNSNVFRLYSSSSNNNNNNSSSSSNKINNHNSKINNHNSNNSNSNSNNSNNRIPNFCRVNGSNNKDLFYKV
ncbi:unnamed protein product [Saccharomyces cerevisiae]|nr:unnamed protein product [Saccharomyces cerevisiae]